MILELRYSASFQLPDHTYLVKIHRNLRAVCSGIASVMKLQLQKAYSNKISNAAIALIALATSAETSH